MTKGKVTVFIRGGMLYFRFPRLVFGKSKTSTTGMFDSPRNRITANYLALKAQEDIFKGEFDYSLERYRPCLHLVPFGQPETRAIATIQELWSQYFEFKSKMWAPSTIRGNGKYSKHINDCPYKYLSQAKLIRNYFFKKLTLDGCHRTFKELAACCDWAIDEELIDENPFRRFVRQIKVPKTSDINPFSKKEKDLIVEAFENHPEHNRYLLFLSFLFKTGCRPSEAVGLRWKSIDLEIEYIRFCEAVVEGKRKNSTKTYVARMFPVNDSLRELLASIRPSPIKPDSPVFRLPGGELINIGNFLERAWKPIFETLEIAYRVPYNTRHTFITWCLKKGIPITTIAQWVGNKPQTIWANYAGIVHGYDPPDDL